MVGVAVLTSIMGFSTAYVTTFFKFSGSRFFHYASILPFAMPTYIISYIYGGMFDITGTVTTFMLDLFEKRLDEVYFLILCPLKALL